MTWLFVGHVALRLIVLALFVVLAAIALRRRARRRDVALRKLESLFAEGSVSEETFRSRRAALLE